MFFEYHDCKYNINIIRKNNKNTYIRFKDNEIIVTTNYLVSDKKIDRLIKDNRVFIEKQIDKFINYNNNKNIDGYMLFGSIYNIIYINSIDDVIIENGKIYASSEKNLDRYLKNYIYRVYSDRLEHFSNLFEESLPKYNLKIRKMKSRWGVCNINNNNITLNLDLSKYDIKYLDYVIIHELSHFIHFNHSKSFWLLVSKYCPNYKEIRNEMKKFIL